MIKNLDMTNNYKYSSYWLKDDLFNVNDGTSNLVALASYKRAIGNFVNIVTDKNIPVQFDERGQSSYTDGKSVVISANMNDKDFDSTVGLALHEGSHIKLTDFNVMKNLMNYNFGSAITDEFLSKLMIKYEFDHTYYVQNYVRDILKDLLNIIEDRRIDYYIYSSAPGYKGYYNSMYDKYFNSKIIDKGLQSSEYRTEDWESYMFRLINITNENRDLDALKVLKDVYKLIGLGTINRLKNTTDVLELVSEMFVMIENSIPTPKSKSQNDNGDGDESQNDNGDGDKSQSGGSGSGDTESKQDSEKGDDTTGDAEGEDSNGDTGDENKNGNSKGNQRGNELTDRQKKQLKSAINKQKVFQNNNISKTKLSKKDKQTVDVLTNAGIDEISVGADYQCEWTRDKSKPVNAVVVRNLTKQLIDSNQFSMFRTGYSSDRMNTHIKKGVQLGTVLGKRLKLRSEERTLITPRNKSGRISGRLLHELGMGNTDIFDTVMVNKYKPAVIHISIDASSSMGGDRWDKSQIAAVAIAKAASMTANLDVVISYRGTTSSLNRKPLVVIAYDSRKDKFNKITQLFKYIKASGLTPEGLAFESIINELAIVDSNSDKYFINFSDGEPYFENSDIYYAGSGAHKHTAAQVKKMRMAGVKILSFFIDGSDLTSFKVMYGKESQSVDVTSLVPLTKTLNKLFE